MRRADAVVVAVVVLKSRGHGDGSTGGARGTGRAGGEGAGELAAGDALEAAFAGRGGLLSGFEDAGEGEEAGAFGHAGAASWCGWCGCFAAADALHGGASSSVPSDEDESDEQ